MPWVPTVCIFEYLIETKTNVWSREKRKKTQRISTDIPRFLVIGLVSSYQILCERLRNVVPVIRVFNHYNEYSNIILNIVVKNLWGPSC